MIAPTGPAPCIVGMLGDSQEAWCMQHGKPFPHGDKDAVLVRPEGDYHFPHAWRRVMGSNDLGLWVDDDNGSTGLLRPTAAQSGV